MFAGTWFGLGAWEWLVMATFWGSLLVLAGWAWARLRTPRHGGRRWAGRGRR